MPLPGFEIPPTLRLATVGATPSGNDLVIVRSKPPAILAGNVFEYVIRHVKNLTRIGIQNVPVSVLSRWRVVAYRNASHKRRRCPGAHAETPPSAARWRAGRQDSGQRGFVRPWILLAPQRPVLAQRLLRGFHSEQPIRSSAVSRLPSGGTPCLRGGAAGESCLQPVRQTWREHLRDTLARESALTASVRVQPSTPPVKGRDKPRQKKSGPRLRRSWAWGLSVSRGRDLNTLAGAPQPLCATTRGLSNTQLGHYLRRLSRAKLPGNRRAVVAPLLASRRRQL